MKNKKDPDMNTSPGKLDRGSQGFNVGIATVIFIIILLFLFVIALFDILSEGAIKKFLAQIPINDAIIKILESFEKIMRS